MLHELTGDADDKRLHWPDRASVGVEQRHRGVHDVIAWSYQLCEPDEQLLLDRMSVFAAGFETDTTEYPRPRRRTGSDRHRLRRRITCRPTGSATRWNGSSTAPSSPQTSRRRRCATTCPKAFASSRRHQLRQRGSTDVDEVARLAARHRRYYRDNVVAGQSAWHRPEEGDWLNWLRPATDNILTAIETSLTEPAEAVIGLEIATTLVALRVPTIQIAGRVATQLTERALEATADVEPPTDLRVAALATLAWTVLWQSRIDYVDRLLDECVALCLPDDDRARTWRDAADDVGLPAPVEFTWGLELLLVQRDPRSVTVLARARQKFAALGDRPGAAIAEVYEAISWVLFMPPAESMARARQHRDRYTGTTWTESWADLPWVLALAAHGDPHESLALGRTAVARHIAAGDRFSANWLLSYRISALTRILGKRMASGDSTKTELTEIGTEIAHLVGGLATLQASIGIVADKLQALALVNTAAAAAAKSVLGEAAYAAAEMRGAQLRPEFDEVQRYALGTLTVNSVPIADVATPITPSRWNELSRAEREVALLAAAGWTNRAIAVRRASSIRTVDAQVASIRQKLLITSRADIAAHVPDELASQVRTEAEHVLGRTS